MPAVGLPIDEELLEHPVSFAIPTARFQSHGGVLKGVGDLENPGLDGIALMDTIAKFRIICSGGIWRGYFA